MLSEKVQDIIFASMLLLLIVVSGVFLKFKDAEEIKLEGIKSYDEEKLFLLNFLKTPVNDKKVVDIISNYEEDEFEELWMEIDKIGDYVFEEDYLVRAVYPDDKILVLGTNMIQRDLDFENTWESYLKWFVELEIRDSQKIPYMEKGVIKVEVLTK